MILSAEFHLVSINDWKTKPVIRRGKTGKKAIDEVYINLYACDISNNRPY
jgi:hypothetical protein